MLYGRKSRPANVFARRARAHSNLREIPIMPEAARWSAATIKSREAIVDNFFTRPTRHSPVECIADLRQWNFLIWGIPQFHSFRNSTFLTPATETKEDRRVNREVLVYYTLEVAQKTKANLCSEGLVCVSWSRGREICGSIFKLFTGSWRMFTRSNRNAWYLLCVYVLRWSLNQIPHFDARIFWWNRRRDWVPHQ
jgi:hypothetical protein